MMLKSLQSKNLSILKPGPLQISRFKIFVLVVLWAGLVLYGFYKIIAYENTAGSLGKAAAVWPADSSLPAPSGLPVIVMAVHPQCPCTKATLTELERLMTRVHGHARAYLLFVKLDGFSEDQVHSRLWKRAEKIPGVQVISDNGGQESKRFGPEISGETLLYNAKGNLIFHGGITDARGHEGDNEGREALSDLILKGTSKRGETKVFGCPVFNLNARKDTAL